MWVVLTGGVNQCNGVLVVFLSVQVSDVNDDVRRAAVTSIGFLLFR